MRGWVGAEAFGVMLEVFHKAFRGATGASKVVEGGCVCKGAPKGIDFLPRV